MKIGKIDKDFIDIINYLDKKGFKPFASCDGVIENHPKNFRVTSAYIAFLKSPQIIDLLAAFLRDRDIFEITISNESNSKAYYYYDNLIIGNRYTVSFSNKKGEITSYFKKIITNVVEGKINITNDEKQELNILNDILEDDKNTDLNFSIAFNSKYQPYMNKKGRINVLKIMTKDGYGYCRNMETLANIICEKYGINKKNEPILFENINSVDRGFVEDEFIVTSCNGFDCEIYFTDEHIGQILEQIKYIKEIGNTLPTREVKEVDYDFDEEDYELDI